MLFLLFPFFVFAAGELTLAAGEKQIDKSCARMMLASIYGAEKSYQAEFGRYSDSLEEIGADQIQCKDWNVEVRIFQGGNEFLATAQHPANLRFNINEKKQINEE